MENAVRACPLPFRSHGALYIEGEERIISLLPYPLTRTNVEVMLMYNISPLRVQVYIDLSDARCHLFWS